MIELPVRKLFAALEPPLEPHEFSCEEHLTLLHYHVHSFECVGCASTVSEVDSMGMSIDPVCVKKWLKFNACLYSSHIIIVVIVNDKVHPMAINRNELFNVFRNGCDMSPDLTLCISSPR